MGISVGRAPLESASESIGGLIEVGVGIQSIIRFRGLLLVRFRISPSGVEYAAYCAHIQQLGRIARDVDYAVEALPLLVKHHASDWALGLSMLLHC